MNVGKFRDTISVYSRGYTAGSEGYASQEKTLVCTVPARRYDAGTREVWEAYAASMRNVVNFEIRPRTDVHSGMWVLCSGLWHEIIAVQRTGEAPGCMILKTTLREVV